ncbi:SDR family NAD(P)-dependent oxidoreductase [Rhodococcus oryzae]|uniref:SDR family NAD(P)-dependent oxidoreductase n=1 Tax=Rhodococcus oryzae TaxID=2571143 RepID=A0ABY2RQB1_9NOCA|nr:SDR family NAD(P)-dependent oxidoreductase [Rhodococcus oryzae]TJZ79390.1 SDR family NAD(P)-dependent oxidoreductase [Rhodococcus oryzae]
MPKTVVVTGANSGIGLAMAHELAARGATVCLACRNQAKAEAAREEIARRTPGAKVDVLSLDLSSFEHIHRFATDLAARHERVDALINNAGASPLKQQFTAEGFELQFGANYLGPFLLTHLLLPQLRLAAEQTGDARIVHVASVAHNIGRIDADTFRGRSKYRPFPAYAQSKLANLMFNYALARRLPDGLSTHAMHPGGVDSDIYRELPRAVHAALRPFLISADRAGRLGAELALSPEYRERSGEYLTAQRPNPVSRRARDVAAQEALYAESAVLAGVEPLPRR